MAVQDSGAKFLRPAIPMLKRIGARNVKKIFRGSYVLAGRVGLSGARWKVRQVQKKRGKGLSKVQFHYARPHQRPGKLI